MDPPQKLTQGKKMKKVKEKDKRKDKRKSSFGRQKRKGALRISEGY